jgi:murein DD-endopeptidase MepM/ murein hydrolase activator NlpD
MNEHYYYEQSDTMAEPVVSLKVEPVEAPPLGRRLRILGRLLTSIICWLILLYLSQSNAGWSCWAKRYYHQAINASTVQTFGKFLQSQAVNSIMATSRQLLRMEAPLSADQPEGGRPEAMADSVWPVQGSIARGFGWYQPANGQDPQFSRGILLKGIPGGKVVAIRTGKVVKVKREPSSGWRMEIDHGAGWLSTYRNLAQPYLKVNQIVVTGALIGKLKLSPKPQECWLELEISEAGRLIDPLTVIQQP